MTSYKMKAAAIYAAAMLITVSLTPQLQAQGGPGDEVFTSILYLWEQAPQKFSDITGDIPWKKLLGEQVNTGHGVKPFSSWYDIPEFEKESAMKVPYKDSPPSYSISAKRFFDSDAACLAYYKSMLAKLPGLLEKDGVEIRVKDDHVFYKQDTEKFNRSVYVKYYPRSVKREKVKKARVHLSVRVVFP